METREKDEGRGVFALGKRIKESIKRDGVGVGGLKLWINAGVLVIGFLFGGCHFAFGAYPLGVAFTASLPCSVWPALAGVVLGSLTLGRGGMIYAMIAVLSVFLRIIISGGSSDKDGELFTESVPLRISSAVICGFVAAVYEALLGGVRAIGLIFGVSMIFFCAAFTFIFSGAFYHGIGVKHLVFGTRSIFREHGGESEARKILFFKCSSAVFIALIALSLERYNIFGVDASFVFAGVITLFAAKRFGALYGAAVGFFSSVLVSGLFSPAFALLGVLAGALFTYGARYAIATGGAGLLLWGAYVSGVSGFLSLLPEYVIAVCIIFPMLKSFEREESSAEREPARERAIDMVGTMALAYRSRQQMACESVERALGEIVPLVTSFLPGDATAEDYSVFLKLLADARITANESRELDEELTSRLEGALEGLGIRGGVVRAFGERRKYVVLAAEDRDGTLITSPEVKKEFERVSSLAFGTPKYYRRADTALMECESVGKYRLEASYFTERGAECEVSGDTVSSFVSEGLYAYGVISDGMGSGARARRSSDFAVRFLKAAVSSGAAVSSALYMINAALRRQCEECSVTLDAFCFDTVTGEAEIVKSGAASSYIKRNGALYRIKSETMPIGLMKRVDAEKIKVSVGEGDVVVMISDGVCEPSDEAPWLVETLNELSTDDLGAFASRVAAAAKLNNKKKDDISVLVMRIAAV